MTRNDRVKELTRRYNTEASSYRDYWAPVLHPAACAMIDGLPERSAPRVLDVGAGTGGLLPALRNRFGGATVIGTDRSEGMISLAEPETVAVSDAMMLSFAGGSFDVVTMAFVLFHLSEPGTGLAEVSRVLRPGGVIGITTWAGEGECRAEQVWSEELDAHGATPKDELPRMSHHDLVDTPKKMSQLLRDAGLVSVESSIREFTHPISTSDLIQLKTKVGTGRQRFESIPESALGGFVGRASERLADLSSDDFIMHLPIVISMAARPS